MRNVIVFFKMSATLWENLLFAYNYKKTKAQISCAVTAQLISAFFCYIDRKSLYFLIQNLKPLAIFCGCTAPGLCQTWSETPKTGFVMMQLIILGSLDIIQKKAFICIMDVASGN